MRLSKRIDAGQVYVNCFSSGDSPSILFGGFKKSGYGREKGAAALHTSTQLKNIAFPVDDKLTWMWRRAMSAEYEFGQVITAMITPFTPAGELYIDGARALARWLTEATRSDGLVVNGTTGESATTSDEEKTALLKAIVDAVDPRVRVIAGVGSSDTRHSVELAQRAEAAGAHALLVVAPYYLRPSQEGLLRHFRAVADATSLPVMLYDVPRRTGVAIESATLVRAAEHERIRAVKDAKGDLGSSSWVMRESTLQYYSGDDALNLPLLSIGAAGFVSVVSHVAGDQLRVMLQAYRSGDVGRARDLHNRLLPIYQGLFRAPAAALTKAALDIRGFPAGPVRSPLVNASAAERETLRADMEAAGVLRLTVPA
jgi:4-hydroxy-tetrahydrodipicolinate synthase